MAKPSKSPSWLDRMIGRVRDAETPDEARAIVHDYIDPATGERTEQQMEPQNGPDDQTDTHVHIHLEKNGNGEGDNMIKDDLTEGDPVGEPEGDPAGLPSHEELVQQVAALASEISQIRDMLENGESDVELTEPETMDARRFKMRRVRAASHDEEDPDLTPERNPEMMGETDLPGIEDLDARMPTLTVRKDDDDDVLIKVTDRKAKAKQRDTFYRTGDSGIMRPEWMELTHLAEIIQPGLRVGTWDGRLTPYKQAERMCALRRRVMDGALKGELGESIRSMTGLRSVNGAPCDAIKVAFHSVANAMRQANNASFVNGQASATRDSGGHFPRGGAPTNSEMNRIHREFYARGNGNGSSRH